MKAYHTGCELKIGRLHFPPQFEKAPPHGVSMQLTQTCTELVTSNWLLEINCISQYMCNGSTTFLSGGAHIIQVNFSSSGLLVINYFFFFFPGGLSCCLKQKFLFLRGEQVSKPPSGEARRDNKNRKPRQFGVSMCTVFLFPAASFLRAGLVTLDWTTLG